MLFFDHIITLSFEGWSSYARPLCVKLPSVPIERAGIVGGHLVRVNFSWSLWRQYLLLLLLLPLCQVASSSLLVSTTRRRVCMIDTILRHGSIPNIGQYLGKDYTNILFQFKYFENQIVFSFCRTFMLLEVVGPARAKLCRVHCQCRTIAADIHCLCQWLSTSAG